jgi:hypothetical protein
VILTIRVWAVWGRDRRLTIGLPIFFAMCFVPCIALMVIFLKSAKRESILLAHSFTFSNLNSRPCPVILFRNMLLLDAEDSLHQLDLAHGIRFGCVPFI